jgi:hypothetical protein
MVRVRGIAAKEQRIFQWIGRDSSLNFRIEPFTDQNGDG